MIYKNSLKQTYLPSTPTQGTIKKIVQAVALAVEVIIRSSVIPASVVVTALAPWTTAQKIESGLKAPEKILELIKTLPNDFRQTEKLIAAIEAPWSIEKIKTLIDLGSSEMLKISKEEIKRIKDMMQGVKNFERMPVETLEAIIVVASAYLFLAFLLRLIRLWDRDTLGDRFRKYVSRSVTGKESFHAQFESLYDAKLSEDEIEKILLIGIEEYKRRRGNMSV